MTMHRTHAIVAFSTLALVAAAGMLLAGPLNPPAGPITSTPGPEPRIAINLTNTPGDADSLFRIAQPGSYYLTGNITGVNARHGIEIASAGVTLDLNGFELLGVPGSFDGVSAIGSDIENVAVFNGSVRNWGNDGVDLTAASGDGCIVRGVRANGNTVAGIVGGFNSVISECVASSNGSSGIDVRGGATIVSCSAFTNVTNGFRADGPVSITGCSSYDNGSNGFSTGDAAVITNCAAYSNVGRGFSVNTAAVVTGCSAHLNGNVGFFSNDGSTIENCSSRFNTLNGIQVTDNCVVLNNTCTSNGLSTGSGAGILATGVRNRIEGNLCTDADRGIEVTGTGNFIARNTCGGNTTNWVVAIGNNCLVVLATPTVAAINGDSGGLSPGSTNPNANFTH